MHDFMIFVGFPSGPDDDFGFSLDIASISSFSFIGWKEKEIECFVRNFS